MKRLARQRLLTVEPKHLVSIWMQKALGTTRDHIP